MSPNETKIDDFVMIDSSHSNHVRKRYADKKIIGESVETRAGGKQLSLRFRRLFRLYETFMRLQRLFLTFSDVVLSIGCYGCAIDSVYGCISGCVSGSGSVEVRKVSKSL